MREKTPAPALGNFLAFSLAFSHVSSHVSENARKIKNASETKHSVIRPLKVAPVGLHQA